MTILDKLIMSKIFAAINTSATVGIRKTDPRIFPSTLMHFEIRPEQAVMVGDSETHDIGGGYAAGLKTVLVDRRQRVEKSLADYRFNSLGSANKELESLYPQQLSPLLINL